MDLSARWNQCKTALALHLAREDAEAWLEGLTLERLEPDRIVLSGVPNSFFRARILTLYREALQACLSSTFPEYQLDPLAQVELRLGSVPVPLEETRDTPTHQLSAPSEQLDLPGLGELGATPQIAVTASPANSAGLDARLTLDRFYASANMRPVLDALEEVVRAPGQRFNPLLLCGSAGMGRTHLLHAIGHALATRSAAKGSPLRILCGSAERFKQEVLEGMQTRRMKSVRERWRAADVLLLDDLHFVLVAPRVQEELLHLFEEYVGSGRTVVFTSDRLPRAMRGLNETLRSRIEAGLVLELTPPDVDARHAYVKRRSIEEGIVLEDAGTRWLAENLRGSLRLAEGVLMRLAAYSARNGRPLTQEFVEHMAAPLISDQAGWGAPVVAEKIISAISERFGIDARALQTTSRAPTLVRARQVAVLLLKEEAGLSYPEMGEWLGQRSPSTMSHALQTLERDMGRHPHVQRLVQQIREDVARDTSSPPPKPIRRKALAVSSRKASRGK